MKNAHPHTGKWLREWFPEQTKSIPRIILWTIVYILDVILVFFLAGMLGFSIVGIPYQIQTVIAGLYLIVALVLFWMEASLYNRILRWFRNRNTLN